MKRQLERILASLARLILRRHHPEVVAITGSVGKTSTRAAIQAVLQSKFSVRSSAYNYNNELGVPLTSGYNGNLTSAQNGSVGGYMVKKMIEAQEKQMAGK